MVKIQECYLILTLLVKGNNLKIIALAGGVGGAKLADGLDRILESGQLSVIVNTGDDMGFCGLHISPDLDTVCYTLAGLANPVTGWGLKNETWGVFETLSKLGGPDWFHLGDHDLALHLERTRLLATGKTLTEVTSSLCSILGVKSQVIPMSDNAIRTMVHTRDNRVLSFQEYFVKEQCNPEVSSFEFAGIDEALPSKEVLAAIEECDLIVFCPSNPWVSIDPILKLGNLKDRMRKKPIVAVSPIIGGKTIKGPAAKMFEELGIQPGALAVAEHYRDLIDGFILDKVDESDADQIRGWGIMPLVTKTIMQSIEDRVQLAKEVTNFGLSLPPKGKELA
jgi:LPPG:FO 2-phospho-L-lactate transferase